jgi:hypothetical protein
MHKPKVAAMVAVCIKLRLWSPAALEKEWFLQGHNKTYTSADGGSYRSNQSGLRASPYIAAAGSAASGSTYRSQTYDHTNESAGSYQDGPDRVFAGGVPSRPGSRRSSQGNAVMPENGRSRDGRFGGAGYTTQGQHRRNSSAGVPAPFSTPTQNQTDMWMTMDPRLSTVSAPDAKGRLENALDNHYMSKQPFLGKYEILGSAYRREGGQGVVQVSHPHPLWMHTGDY